MSDLVRFSVTMPADLSASLDAYAARRGIASNRSEVIRDLVRDALAAEQAEDEDALIFGTLTMVYNHHFNDLHDRLDAIQHKYFQEIVSTVHVHLDQENCLEVILMRGQSKTIHTIADELLGMRGVYNGKLVVTTLGAPEVGDHEYHHAHEHGMSHDHPHTHTHTLEDGTIYTHAHD